MGVGSRVYSNLFPGEDIVCRAGQKEIQFSHWTIKEINVTSEGNAKKKKKKEQGWCLHILPLDILPFCIVSIYKMLKIKWKRYVDLANIKGI